MTVKLFELKRGDKFTLHERPSTPPDSIPYEFRGVVYTFSKVDGMYAPVKDPEGETHYFSAWTLVDLVEIE